MEKKKIVIIAVAAVLALALVITGTVILVKNLFKGTSGSYDDFTITVGDVEGKIGDTVKVPVTCYENPGFMAIIGNFTYDSTLLEYVGYKEGDVLSDYDFNDKGDELAFLSLEDGDVDNNGVLFYLEFKIVAEKATETDLKLTIENEGICNIDEEIIPVEIVNGSVKISK